MTEKAETIGTNQGDKPSPDQPVSHENEVSAGPHDGDHQVVINVNTQKEGKTNG